MIPLICPRNCPDRCAEPNCHSDCPQYAELRAVCDKAADERRKSQLVCSFTIESKNSRRAPISEKRARLKSFTSGR